MEVLRGTKARASGERACVATIGVFDGVHRGHTALFEVVTSEAKRLSARAAIVTFEPHPVEVLAPDRAPCVLTTIDQRLELFEAHGFDLAVVLRFDRAFANLTPADFVRAALVAEVRARKVVVGEDFRFGHDRAGDVAPLAELGRKFGFEAQAIELVGADDGKIGSSEIRRLIADGKVERAADLLGRGFALAGKVVGGQKIARELHGFPTVNLETHPRACVPGLGVYGGWWIWRGRRLPGVVNVGRERGPGIDPTPVPVVEIHIFDFDEDVRGEEGEIEFTAFIRPELRFEGVDALMKQIRADADQAREILTGSP